MTNLAVPNRFTFHVGNQTFINAVDNYIGPNYTSIILNGATYVLYLSAPAQISNSTYIELLNVSYLPILHSVTLRACPNGMPAGKDHTTPSTTKLNISNVSLSIAIAPLELVSTQPADLTKSVSVENASNVPGAPDGFTIYSAMRVRAANLTDETTFEVHAEFQCGLDNMRPYVLKGGAWVAITPFNVDSSACTVSFAISNDTIIALMIPETAPTKQAQSGIAGSTSTILQQDMSAPQESPSANYAWLAVPGLFILMASIGFAVIRSRVLYAPDIDLSSQYLPN